ncbi:LemA family protein [Bisgaard Taxon 10/6]|uniref:LemA family protein n=1 Tax=Exercitatus varius TaxID=67857 RepID=A0AAW6Q6V5_9PAST|nr:LemA family protein [Exercitatus varius]QOF68218.1 LemA family protein [Actinobacillus sp. GY-402]MDG2914685.1 LemA family protein [Exercitatus varius]MDG2917158.1 LemA family protein [Exercitatus varius]MDG2939254.1 LemA family protein [Exercitatus varius]MDG2942666.1 LemA family protein [Exercitatus varius]
MKKWLVVIIVAVIAGFMLMSSYNSLVKAEEEIDSVWANVETQYQHRSDLIPNLVNTVKGQANFEKETLTSVMEARAKATQTKIDPANLTEEQLAQFQQNQNQVGSALSRLLVTVEKYPELKSGEAFMTLQAQLEGMENRINVARNKFNEAAKVYNAKVRTFPTKLAAMIFGFKEKPYFKSVSGAENAPSVNFQ